MKRNAFVLAVLGIVLFAVIAYQPQSMCFHFEFGEDPLDPGDRVTFYGPLYIYGTGFVNLTDNPMSPRTLCFNRITNPKTFYALMNSYEPVTIKAETGSVDIASVSMEVNYGY